MMNDKLKFILLYGGIFWGSGFTFLMLIHRYIFIDPTLPEASLIGLYISLCFVAGLIWGICVYRGIEKSIS
ncbi:hypothetical protein [Acinetobacter soli]|uniref:hypothetical protein n=2 Tax=Moraxellaceae TaxID=468 RepID=UPI00125F9346|nr:hypothetical protein [Acinetobacter soli]